MNPFEVEYIGIFSFRNEAWQVLQTRAASKSMLGNSAARIVTQLIGAGFRSFLYHNRSYTEHAYYPKLFSKNFSLNWR